MTPLFSLLIPTKGRPEFVRDAIASVLLQEGAERDFEVVVSNNGGGEETKSAVGAWRQDDRFVYIEPPKELSMPDHWEWASKLLKGEYVLVLTDRMMLRQGALESLRSLIEAKPRPLVISWPLASYSEVTGATANTRDEDTQITEHRARAVWETLKQGQYLPSPVHARGVNSRELNSVYDILPRGLNSCVHRSVYDKVRAVRGRAFDWLTPDFSSAFSVVLVSEVILHHARPLTIQQGVLVSNGRLMRLGVDTGYMKPLGSRGLIQHVPLSDMRLPFPTAMIYEDLFRTAAVFGVKLRWTDINAVAFYRECSCALVVRHVGTAPWNPALRRSRKLYRDAIRSEGVERSKRIKRELRGSFPLRELLSATLYAWSHPRLLKFLRRAKLRWTGADRYATALEAAGFGNAVHSPTNQTRARRIPDKEVDVLDQRE